MMARRALTDSEKAARAARIASLAAAAKSLEESGAVDVDRAIDLLSGYSRRNVLMILAQAAERGRDLPAAVAGFHDWRKSGRSVRKGAQGYLIFAPVVKGSEEDQKIGFTVRYVFDVADTDPLSVESPVLARDLDKVEEDQTVDQSVPAYTIVSPYVTLKA